MEQTTLVIAPQIAVVISHEKIAICMCTLSTGIKTAPCFLNPSSHKPRHFVVQMRKEIITGSSDWQWEGSPFLMALK